MDAVQLREAIKSRKRADLIFAAAGFLALLVGLVTLLALLVDLAVDGTARLRPEFLLPFRRALPSRPILSAWAGSCLVMLVTATAAVPLGVSAGIYLEEYAPKNWFTEIIEVNITNLAGVPSIIFGLMALGLFVYGLGLGRASSPPGSPWHCSSCLSSS